MAATPVASLFESLVPKLSAGGRHTRYSVCASCTNVRLADPARNHSLEAREWLKIIILETAGTTAALKKDRQVVLLVSSLVLLLQCGCT